jgi:hypothetical protein
MVRLLLEKQNSDRPVLKKSHRPHARFIQVTPPIEAVVVATPPFTLARLRWPRVSALHDGELSAVTLMARLQKGNPCA